ncbi:MAG: hypothetical protein Tsb0016_24700 [Sphingomonadales bacterium]
MIRRLAWVMLAVLGVVFVGLSGIYLYFRYDNYAALRELIRRQAYASLGGDLALDGPVDIEVGDDTRIFLRNITLTNPDPGYLRSIIAIREARIAVPTANAIGRNFTSAEIDLYGVRVEVGRDGAASQAAPPTDLEAAAAARGIDLPGFDAIRAHDVELTLKGIWGRTVRRMGFDMVSIRQQGDGGFQAALRGTPNGLATRMEVAAAPLGDATPGASWRLALQFGDSDLEMLAELRAVRRLFARIAVKSQRIQASDVAALIGPPQMPVAEVKPLLGAEDVIPVGWVNILDASLKAELAEVIWDQATTALSLQGRLESGRLSLAPVVLSLGEGGAQAQASLDMARLPATLTVSANLEQASPALAAPLLGALGPWSGLMDGVFEGQASGDKFGRLARLDGVARLRVLQGQVDPSAHDLAQRESFARLFDSDAPTPVPCLALETAFSKGRLIISNATLVTGLGRMALSGDIDWPAQRYDLLFITAPDDGPERRATRRTQLTGAFGQPAWQEEVLDQRWLALAKPAAACTVAAVAPR